LSLIDKEREDEALLLMLGPTGTLLAPHWSRSIGLGQAGNTVRLLLHRTGLRNWRLRARRLLIDRAEMLTACELLDLYWLKNKRSNYHFFAFRYGQARYLASLSFTTLIRKPAGPLLDVGCGCGNLTTALIARGQGQPVYGLDAFFPGLFVAKNWVAPQAHFVCASVELSLPFADNCFSAVYFSETLQYIEHKPLCFREAKRTAAPGAPILITLLTNSLVPRPGGGNPLSPAGYSRLAGSMPHRLVGFSDTLEAYIARRGPPLMRLGDLRRLNEEKLLSLVACEDESFFSEQDSFSAWPHAEGSNLQISPLYQASLAPGGNCVDLQLRFPTPEFEREHSECLRYMAPSVTITARTLLDLADNRRTPAVMALADQFLAFSAPPRYAVHHSVEQCIDRIRANSPAGSAVGLGAAHYSRS
jgi:SAM-dependent methyltransferase